MATSYPAALDSTGSTLPIVATGVDNLNAGGNKSHDTKHGIEDGAIIALETKLGTGASTPAAGGILRGTAAGASGWLALGTAGQVLTVNAGATDIAFATPNPSLIPLTSGGGSVAAGATNYVGAGCTNASEASARIPLAAPYTATKLYVVCGLPPSASGANESATYTLRKNGVDTAITCVISGASATTGNDTAHSVAYAAGDTIDLKVVMTNNGNAQAVVHNAMVST